MSSLGHFVCRWPIFNGVFFILVLMLFFVTPSPAGPPKACKGLWCYITTHANDWHEKLWKTRQQRKKGWHRGPLRMPLLKNHPILQSGKKVVYFGWLGKAKRFHLSIRNTKNNKTWEKKVKDTFVKVKSREFDFEVGKYQVKLTSFVKDTKTGKYISKTKDYKFTVKDEGCLKKPEFQELEKLLSNSRRDELAKRKVRATWLSTQYRCEFEAYQQVAREESLKETSEGGLAAGEIFEEL